MKHVSRRRFLQGTFGGLTGAAVWRQGGAPRAAPAQAPDSSQMVWAVHVPIAPTWFDPAETSGIITPFMFMYAIHDALLKPMPNNPMAPSLATGWTESPDGLFYDFALRQPAKFPNADPSTPP